MAPPSIAKIGDFPLISDMPVVPSYQIPKGEIWIIGHSYQAAYMHPSNFMKIMVGRVPFWTRHMPGVREAERDRRRHPKVT